MTYEEQGRLERFWAWWWPSILSWLPANVRHQLHRPPAYEFLRWNGSDFGDRLTSGDNAIGSVIALPAHLALVRPIRLPITAIPRLQDIAAFEVDRQTPFSIANAYYVAAPLGSTPRSGTSFEAILVVVPKPMLEAAVDAARTSPARLFGVDVLDTDGRPLGVNLLPVRERFRSPEKWRRWNGALVVISLIATFGILFSVMQARQRGLSDLQERFEPLQAQASETVRRERMLVQLESSSATRVGGEQPLALAVLSELSRYLPHGSYLLQIRLENGVVSIRGRTNDLGIVLQQLGRSALWSDPKLSGSRTLPDGKEQEFSLTLTLGLASS